MNKKQIKIPKYIIAIIIIILACIIFLVAAMVPFLKQKPNMDKKHESAEKEKASLNPYVDNRDKIQASIAQLQEDYSKKNVVLFENAKRTPEEVKKLVDETAGVKFVSLSVSEGTASGSIKTVEGGALKSTKINLTLNASETDLMKIIDFIEIRAKGTYYISSISFEKEKQQVKTEDGTVTETTSDENRYTYGIQIQLYYFVDVTGTYNQEDDDDEDEDEEEETSKTTSQTSQTSKTSTVSKA